MAGESRRRGERDERPDEYVPPDRFAIKVTVTPETLAKLLGQFDLDVGDRPHVEPTADGAGVLHAFAPDEQIREIESAGYGVEVGENVTEIGRQRMADVVKGDPFEGGRIPPRGLGHKPGRGPEHRSGEGEEPR